MTVFHKLAILATAALAAMAAPIDTQASSEVPRNTSAPVIPASEMNVISAAASTGVGTFSGRGTWFTDKTGSCDTQFDTNDMIVAMNEAQMGGGAQCGKSVKITYNGKTVNAKVVDTCPKQYCSSGALDLSQAAFKKLAPLDDGVIDIKWQFA
ncbi:hypothetical protein BGZ67_004339 [Mortierella alpina]|nr:hypothetical protein BGZ67_004339 [Mortierella alpina]